MLYCLPGATTSQTQLNNQCTASNNNNNNPHSTTSPNSSPANVSLTNSSQLTPPPHADENDNTMNDDAFENDDNISVTGSPAHANSTEDDERRSPSPFQSSSSTIPPPPQPPSSLQATAQNDTLGNGGAFTSLIQRNTKKGDFLSNFQTHLHQRPAAVSAAAVAAAAATAHPSLHPQLPQQNHSALNHALAAQLFLQSPLMPQPSQWLYTQLYGANYNELPWLRSTLQSTNGNRLMAGCANNVSAETILTQSNRPLCTDIDAFERGGDGGGSGGGGGGGSANRRCVTLISHLDDEKEASASPPVTSTKRTPSPHDDIEIVCNTIPVKPSKGDSSLKCRTPKHVDVWRPY